MTAEDYIRPEDRTIRHSDNTLITTYMEKTTLKKSGFYAAPDFVQYEIRTEKGFAASELDFRASDYTEGENIY